MKLRNIIPVMCVMASVFTACVNEIPVGDSPETVQAGDLSIVFAVGDAQTKTEAAPGYEWATPDELEINHVTIAVFDDEDKCVRFAKNPELTEETVTVDDKSFPGRRASLSGLPINKSLKFVVIANSANNFDGLGVGSSYSDFEKLTEETGDFPHAKELAKTLVKVGTVTTTLSVETTEVQVPLHSLSARIDFGGVTSLVDGDKTTTLPNDEYGDWVQLEDNDSNRDLLNELLQSVGDYKEIEDLKEKGWGDGTSSHSDKVTWDRNFYYYVKKTGHGRNESTTTYRISFYKQEIKKNQTRISKQGAYWDYPIILSGANKSSFLLYTTDNQFLYEKANDVGCDDTTFYSYPSGDSQFQLVFTLKCDIGESVTEEYDSQVRYAYVIQTRFFWGYNPGYPYPEKGELVTIPDANEYAELLVKGKPEDVGKVSKTVKDPIYETCRLTIDGNQLRAGHLYRLTGTYNPPVSKDIIWQVAGWNEEYDPVNIEFGH